MNRYMISESVCARALVALCKDESFVWLSLINDMHLSCAFEGKKKSIFAFLEFKDLADIVVQIKDPSAFNSTYE